MVGLVWFYLHRTKSQQQSSQHTLYCKVKTPRSHRDNQKNQSIWWQWEEKLLCNRNPWEPGSGTEKQKHLLLRKNTYLCIHKFIDKWMFLHLCLNDTSRVDTNISVDIWGVIMQRSELMIVNLSSKQQFNTQFLFWKMLMQSDPLSSIYQGHRLGWEAGYTWKPAYLERTHANTGWTCKLHTGRPRPDGAAASV